MTERIDPHTHSNCSDGTESPAEVMRQASLAGLDMIGLTDHDTTAGWEEAAAAVPETGVALLRGTEISCTYEGITVHMLSYLHDPQDEDLNAMFAKVLQSRLDRSRIMVERLSEDFDISYEDVEALAPEGVPVGRPHIADALVGKGYFKDRGEAFEKALHPRHKYYAKLWSPEPLEVIAAIRKAGGVPVFAHPRAATRQRRFVPYAAIRKMAQAGLFGIEVYHRDHNPEWQEVVAAMARRLKLHVFGSSDYHGDGKPNRLGENLTDPAVISELLQQGKLEVIRP